jgi:signal transduction histidine kinase
MINGLLEYARIGKIKKDAEKVDIQELVLELKDLLVPSHIRFEIIHKLPVLVAERIRIEQIFSNLLSNAVKYNNSSAPFIHIDYQELKNFHEFTVEDNGPGIDQQYFEKIFMIFQTLQERDAFESTGVGLAIVKKIIEDNQGTIRVSSTNGVGTKFTFTLPKK